MSSRVQSPPAGSSASASTSSSRSASRRLLKELDAWNAERREETGIERLGPHSGDELLSWEAVINGKGIGGGYEGTYVPRLHDALFAPLSPRRMRTLGTCNPARDIDN